MSTGASALADLTAHLLELEGAMVERVEPETLDVLAPHHVRKALGLPELARLGFGGEIPPGTERAGLESDFVDRLEGLLGERGRRLRLAVSEIAPAPRSPDRLLERALVLDNATYRLTGVERAWTAYVLPTFRYVARSDDQREGLVTFGVNAGTSSVIEDATPLLEAPARSCGPMDSTVPELSAERLEALTAAVLPALIEARLTPFVAGLRRRLRRDAHRLLAYYGRLREEALVKLERAATRTDGGRAEARVRREEQRLGSIAREHASKLEDLRRRYALVVHVEWMQTLELVAPVHRLNVEIRRRKKKRNIPLDLNPFTRRLDSPPAECGHADSPSRVVCDAALHLVSRKGHAPCPACEKSYCRACHPSGCPRCREVGRTRFGE